MPMTTSETTFTEGEIKEAIVAWARNLCGGEGPILDPNRIEFRDESSTDIIAFAITAVAHH